MKTETTLGIVEKTEALVGLRDRDNVHETSRVGLVSPDFPIDLDMPLHQDGDHFTVSESVLQLVPDDKNEGKTLPRLMWSGRWLGGLFGTNTSKHRHSDYKQRESMCVE